MFSSLNSVQSTIIKYLDENQQTSPSSHQPTVDERIVCLFEYCGSNKKLFCQMCLADKQISTHLMRRNVEFANNQPVLSKHEEMVYEHLLDAYGAVCFRIYLHTHR